ncbi:flagellar export protein FliJ [Acetivibrio cellulolyticus]|uniref:flagellar export protein FliJ n=1 Tax=Acetivibrio cellulolyticus TaxID=35830 RepID=UPI0001E2C24B|nr:flagellar export protein FliJ [Acetivibrio cellulolyticus]
MGKFVFKLQAVLNLKKQIENNAKNELGKAVQELERQKNILKEIEAERDEYIGEINSKSSSGISIGKLKEYSSYISLLKDRIEHQKNNIKRAQKSVDKYREQLIIAVQERKMMEKLREKKYEEYMKEQQKEEQKVIDEIASFKYTSQP